MVKYVPMEYQNLLNIASIVHLKAVSILVAFKLLADKISEVILWCDNYAVVNAFSCHKIRDPCLMACAEQLEVRHIAGKSNIYADILSSGHVFQVLTVLLSNT